MLIRPRPGDWRAPLALPLQGRGKTYDERRAFLKQCAIDRIKRVHGIDIEQPDAAEAANIAEWFGDRIVKLGKYWKPGKPVTELKWAA